ncbi:alpha/beta fold hydrolase [Streptomyces sp. NPDC001292]|uniref:alpha/beta fold hydrolase n=1 Tax=Streptomyces sp. NPDC001292 TaxID=3364558 RepID=UPI0036C4F1DE
MYGTEAKSPIRTQRINVDDLSIRYADSGAAGPHALLLSPWPESLFAFEPTWAALTRQAHVVAVDLPGFGQSDSRADLFSPRATADFLIRVMDELSLERVHVVGPDVGTSAALFAAAGHPDRFHSVVVGSGGTSFPLELGEPLAGWVTGDLDQYRAQDPEQVITATMAQINPARPIPDHIRADYLASYAGRRFVDSMLYVRTYPTELPALGDTLPGIQTPVRIIAGAHDPVVPPSNAQYLHARLSNSTLDVVDAGHFVWEEAPDTYASLVIEWWKNH